MVRALPVGRLSYGKEGTQGFRSQLCLLAEDEGQTGPCPRSSVTHMFSGDQEVLCVLGVLRHGESSGALKAIGRFTQKMVGISLVGQGSSFSVPAGIRPSLILWS